MPLRPAEYLLCAAKNMRHRISMYILLAVRYNKHLFLMSCFALISRLLLSAVHTTDRPSCRDLLLCCVCCSFIALHFAPHSSYSYASLPPKVVFILYSEFLDSNKLKEMSICLVLRITDVYCNVTCIEATCC